MNWQDDNLEKENVASNIEDVRDRHRAVQFAVIQICQEQDTLTSSRTSPRALAALAELTYQYVTKVLASDLDCFANHAGRRTINEHDVKLVVRRNPSILTKLENKLNDRGNLLKENTNILASNNRKKMTKIDLQKKNKRKTIDYENANIEDSDASSTSTDEDLIFEQCFNRKSFGSAKSASLEEDPFLSSSRHTARIKQSVATSAILTQKKKSFDVLADSDSESLAILTLKKKSLDVLVDSDSESSTDTRFKLVSSDAKKISIRKDGKERFRLQHGIDRSSSKDAADSDEESFHRETKAARIEQIMESTLSQSSITSS